MAYLSLAVQTLHVCSPSAFAQIFAYCHVVYFAGAFAQTVALVYFVYVFVCCDAVLSSQISVYFVLSYFGDAFASQMFVHFVCSRSDVAFGAGILVSSHVVELVDVLAFPGHNNLLLCYASV